MVKRAGRENEPKQKPGGWEGETESVKARKKENQERLLPWELREGEDFWFLFLTFGGKGSYQQCQTLQREQIRQRLKSVF